MITDVGGHYATYMAGADAGLEVRGGAQFKMGLLKPAAGVKILSF
jgi:hypothetical protein